MKNQYQYHDESMWKGAPANNFLLAMQLRERMTQAEILMWDKLKNKQFKGYKFRRQHPIHKFIVDFYCHELKLIIEIDGKYHDSEEQKNEDLIRTELLNFQGLREIRFTNEEVITDISSVLKKLEEQINYSDTL
ncbi:endonuclease domain-containing protein [Flavobacterium sp.]|uniref:endonuclease domain-containing protein n=1 Tax=Flavobacterium sp. TaxID=239 RepID=UPI0037533C74